MCATNINNIDAFTTRKPAAINGCTLSARNKPAADVAGNTVAVVNTPFP